MWMAFRRCGCANDVWLYSNAGNSSRNIGTSTVFRHCAAACDFDSSSDKRRFVHIPHCEWDFSDSLIMSKWNLGHFAGPPLTTCMGVRPYAYAYVALSCAVGQIFSRRQDKDTAIHRYAFACAPNAWPFAQMISHRWRIDMVSPRCESWRVRRRCFCDGISGRNIHTEMDSLRCAFACDYCTSSCP